MVENNEKILKFNLKFCCTKLRQQAMQSARVQILESGLTPLQIVDPMLFSQERVKLY